MLYEVIAYISSGRDRRHARAPAPHRSPVPGRWRRSSDLTPVVEALGDATYCNDDAGAAIRNNFV